MAASSPEEWYRSLPLITRGYLTASFAATVLTQMEFLDPYLLILDFDKLVGSFELWRLVTNFCFFGKFGLPLRLLYVLLGSVRQGARVQAV